MTKPKSYSFALEIDRDLKLNLSNGQFENLASFIDGYADNQKISNELMKKPPTEIIGILNTFKIK